MSDDEKLAEEFAAEFAKLAAESVEFHKRMADQLERMNATLAEICQLIQRREK